MQDIYQKHRESLTPAILAEIEKRSDALAAASPAGHLRFLQAPVLLLHGSDDTIIPPTELLWLKRDIPQDNLVDALESPAIGHVEVGTKITLVQRLALVHWMALMIHTARSSGSGQGTTNLPAGMWIGRVLQPVSRSPNGQHIRRTVYSNSTWSHSPTSSRRSNDCVALPFVLRLSLTSLLRRTSTPDLRGQLWFKPENLQPIGAFKIRGAYNKIASLTDGGTPDAASSPTPAAITPRASLTRHERWARKLSS